MQFKQGALINALGNDWLVVEDIITHIPVYDKGLIQRCNETKFNFNANVISITSIVVGIEFDVSERLEANILNGGITITLEAVSATTSWKQLGLSIEEATKQAEKSLIFSNISEQNIETATKELKAILAGFTMDIGDIDRIMDALNEAGNKTTSITADIATGLLKSSSALNIANNSLEESIGLMVAGNAAIQNANVVGTGLKTVSMRLRGVANDEGVLISDLQKKVKELANVDVMLADKVTFKSTPHKVVRHCEKYGKIGV